MLRYLIIYVLFSACLHALEVESNMAVNNSYLFENVSSYHFRDMKLVEDKWKNSLSFYRLFKIEGENLKKSCISGIDKVKFSSPFVEEGVETSFIATLQMLIFENVIPAIYAYAKLLAVSDSEYKNIYTNLINESCSNNTSVLSERRITKIFSDQKFKNSYILPSLDGNPLFNEFVNSKQSLQYRLAKELKYTMGLFKVACSWGQKVDAYRGLTELIKNPIISSFVIRQMSGLKISNNFLENKQSLISALNSTRVHCDGIICRKKVAKNFIKEFPKSMGHVNISHDLKSIYCNNILEHKQEFEPVMDVNRDNFIESYSGDEGKRLVGQFISLITKIPDFNVWTDDPVILDYYLKQGIDNFWNGWANKTRKHIEDNLLYEEPLELTVVNHDKFLSSYPKKLVVELDLNSGEFDKMISIEGKIEFSFKINILDTDLLWLYKKYRTIDPTQKEELEKIDNLLLQYVKSSYANVKDDFSAYIIDGDVSKMLANEIKAQLLYINELDIVAQAKMTYIQVNINISPFALVYLKNKKLMSNEYQYEVSRDAQFDAANRIDSMALEAKE